MNDVVDQLLAAVNAHDVEAIVACFAEDYALESPVHPAKSFRGREPIRRNWTAMLDAVPSLEARVLRRANHGDEVWTEWEMKGSRRDGGVHDLRGVFIFEVNGGRVRSGRMYLEPVEQP